MFHYTCILILFHCLLVIMTVCYNGLSLVYNNEFGDMKFLYLFQGSPVVAF